MGKSFGEWGKKSVRIVAVMEDWRKKASLRGAGLEDASTEQALNMAGGGNEGVIRSFIVFQSSHLAIEQCRRKWVIIC